MLPPLHAFDLADLRLDITDRNPRSMMPMPPSSATAIAISARVIVSMLADTIGRFNVRVLGETRREIERRRIPPLDDAYAGKQEVVERTAAHCLQKIGHDTSLFPEQRLVVAIVLAEEFVDAIELGQQRERARDEPRTGEYVRVLDDRSYSSVPMFGRRKRSTTWRSSVVL